MTAQAAALHGCLMAKLLQHASDVPACSSTYHMLVMHSTCCTSCTKELGNLMGLPMGSQVIAHAQHGCDLLNSGIADNASHLMCNGIFIQVACGPDIALRQIVWCLPDFCS